MRLRDPEGRLRGHQGQGLPGLPRQHPVTLTVPARPHRRDQRLGRRETVDRRGREAAALAQTGTAAYRRCGACDVADRRRRHQPRHPGRGGGSEYPGGAAERGARHRGAARASPGTADDADARHPVAADPDPEPRAVAGPGRQRAAEAADGGETVQLVSSAAAYSGEDHRPRCAAGAHRDAGGASLSSSWPGLSGLSTPCLLGRCRDVDARHKAGHDVRGLRPAIRPWLQLRDRLGGQRARLARRGVEHHHGGAAHRRAVLAVEDHLRHRERGAAEGGERGADRDFARPAQLAQEVDLLPHQHNRRVLDADAEIAIAEHGDAAGLQVGREHRVVDVALRIEIGVPDDIGYLVRIIGKSWRRLAWTFGGVGHRGVYGFMPAGAICEEVSPISSSALRTRPEAFASSMKSLTQASAAGRPFGTQTAVEELRKASSSTREPGIFLTRPPSDSRESAIAWMWPSSMACAARSTLANSTCVAFGVALTAARKVAVLATPPMPTPFALASATEAIFEPGATRNVLCSR